MPAERSPLHEWINSAGIVITFCIAAFAAWISWKTYQLKEENIVSEVFPASNCNVEFWHEEKGDAGMLAMCWHVRVSNVSESKLSIISATAWQTEGRVVYGYDSAFKFHNNEEIGGGKLDFPIVLDSGMVREFVVRAPIPIPASVAIILDALPAQLGKPLSSMSMRDLERTVAAHQLSLLGDSIRVQWNGNEVKGWSQDKNQSKSATAGLYIETGRGRKFSTPLVWPEYGGAASRGNVYDD